MNDFHKTTRGVRFFEAIMPSIARSLESIAVSLKELVEITKAKEQETDEPAGQHETHSP